MSFVAPTLVKYNTKGLIYMTYRQWEESLLNYLKGLSDEEKKEIVSYYREIYSDKIDSGIRKEEIVKTFGDPMLAAARILKESADAAERDPETEKAVSVGEKESKIKTKAAPVLNKNKEKARNAASSLTVSKIVGWFFITVLILIPLAGVVIGAIASLASVTLAGGAMLVGGIVAAVASPLLFIIGYEMSGVLFVFGAALITAGTGALLFVVFYYLTKYSIVSCTKLCKYAIRRDK